MTLRKRGGDYELERKMINLRKGTYEAFQIIGGKQGGAKILREVLWEWLRRNAPHILASMQ